MCNVTNVFSPLNCFECFLKWEKRVIFRLTSFVKKIIYTTDSGFLRIANIDSKLDHTIQNTRSYGSFVLVLDLVWLSFSLCKHCDIKFINNANIFPINIILKVRLDGITWILLMQVSKQFVHGESTQFFCLLHTSEARQSFIVEVSNGT